MTRHLTSLMLLASVFSCLTNCCSMTWAQKLGDVVEESKAEWLIGTWGEVRADEDAEDSQTTVTFEWQLDRHSILVKFESASTKACGLVTFRAHENKVLYVAADNHGATGSGEWTLNDGHPTLLYKQVSESGKETKAGFVHKKVDEKTMLIEIYELDEHGELTGVPLALPRFERR